MNWFELANTYPLQTFIEEAYGVEFRNGKCLCPFHPDSNPSMNIVSKKEPHYFNCVVCGAAGDIVKWVELSDSIEPKEAAKKILLHYGVEVGKPLSEEEQAVADKEQQARIDLLKKEGAKKEKRELNKKAKVIAEMTVLSQKLVDNLSEAFANNNEEVIAAVIERFPLIYNNTEVRDAYLGWDYDHDSLVIINRDMTDGKTFNIKYYREKDKKGVYKPGKWISRYDSTTAVFGLYFLQKEGPIFVCEGEKDAINLMLLGCSAVTLGGVSNSWDAYKEVLNGRDVILWFDNDKAGYANAVFRAKELEENTKTCICAMFNRMGNFSNKYDISDFLSDKKIENKNNLMHAIAYSCFVIDNRVIEETLAGYEWDNKEKWIIKRLNEHKTVDKVTSFYENVPTITKHIHPVRGEKDNQLQILNDIHKKLLESGNLDKLAKFTDSLFLEDHEAFFTNVKDFKEFLKTKADVMKEFRQVHIFDIYDGVFKCITTAGFDLWKFRGKLYFWTGSYFSIVTPWELEHFVFNIFMPQSHVEKKKILARNSKEVIENIHSKATPMEIYVKDDARVINLINGVLIVRKNGTHTFRDHHKKTDCATNLLNFHYDPNAVCKKWDKFLKRILPEEGDRMMLEEFMGYCLLPTHEYEHFLFMYGSTGANGKSVILEVIRNFFSRENVGALDLAQFQGHELEGLVNKIVNMGSEVNTKKDLSEQLAVLKKLVSPYDTISIDPKFEKQFVLYPHEKPKCIFAGNKKLSYDADDGGVLRRMLLLTFDQTIEQNEMIRDLPDRLLDESSGILNRLLQGIGRLTVNNGFTLSDNRKQEMDEFKKEINPIRAYVLDNIKKTPGILVPKELVYTHYKRWCEIEGRKSAPAAIFWKEFKSIHDFEIKRPSKTGVYSELWGERPRFISGFSLLTDLVDIIKKDTTIISIEDNRFSEIGFCPVALDE